MSVRTAQGEIEIARDASRLRRRVRVWRKAGESVALVPTMGALHEGHVSLVRLAGEAARRVVVSVFVNRPQFGSEQDFATYPRAEAADAEKLAATPAALVYAPTMEGMYPEGYATTVTVEGPALDLEGKARPGHFAAVATVVAKLLIQCAPDIAVFGEKDYQQLLVVRRLVRDLDLPVRILAGPTIREADGLACSSRNAHLSPRERAIAPALYRALSHLAIEVKGARASAIEPACSAAHDGLLAAGFDHVDYVAVRDAKTLAPIERITAPARALAAARLGHTRLIDNVPVTI